MVFGAAEGGSVRHSNGECFLYALIDPSSDFLEFPFLSLKVVGKGLKLRIRIPKVANRNDFVSAGRFTSNDNFFGKRDTVATLAVHRGPDILQELAAVWITPVIGDRASPLEDVGEFLPIVLPLSRHGAVHDSVDQLLERGVRFRSIDELVHPLDGVVGESLFGQVFQQRLSPTGSFTS